MSPSSYLLFHQGGGLWGIESAQVARIGADGSVLRVELAPGAASGAASDAQGGDQSTAGPVALNAERVEGVVEGLAVRPLSTALRTFWPEAGIGVALHAGRPVVLLDPLHLPPPLVASGEPDA